MKNEGRCVVVDIILTDDELKKCLEFSIKCAENQQDIEFGQSDTKPRAVAEIGRDNYIGKIAEVAKLDDIFFQTHRSFVVNVNNVTSVDRTANMVFFEGDESCLLSRTRKKELLERLKNR